MPKIKPKNKLVNRQAVGTYQGRLHSRQAGLYGAGKAKAGERKPAAPEPSKKPPTKAAKAGAGGKPGLSPQNAPKAALDAIKGGPKGAKGAGKQAGNGEAAKMAGSGIRAAGNGEPKGKKNRIECDGQVVDISTLKLDPLNARLHPERNLEAIKLSLTLYGQRKPLVVRKQNMTVAAGNGTVEAAKALGWTKIAASIRPMTDIEFAGYGLADNRSAELAKWDFEVVARIDRLLQEAKHAPVGWSKDELEVLRAADWTPPPIKEVEEGSDEPESLVVSFTLDQYRTVGKAIKLVRQDGNQLEQSEAIERICEQWLTDQ